MWPFKPKHKDSIEVRAAARAVLDLLEGDAPRNICAQPEVAGCNGSHSVMALAISTPGHFSVLVIPKQEIEVSALSLVPESLEQHVELRVSPSVWVTVTDKDLVRPLCKWFDRYREQKHEAYRRDVQRLTAAREQAFLDLLDPAGIK